MLTIQIQDEQLARQLQRIAEQENRPVEEVLKQLLAHYPENSPAQHDPIAENPSLRRIRLNAYSKARQYWQSIGDASKATLSDEQLDEQFAVFDEQGVPRLKSELTSLEPPIGSLAYAAQMARIANIHTANPLDAAHTDDILNEEFADYLQTRTQRTDAAQ